MSEQKKKSLRECRLLFALEHNTYKALMKCMKCVFNETKLFQKDIPHPIQPLRTLSYCWLTLSSLTISSWQMPQHSSEKAVKSGQTYIKGLCVSTNRFY